MHRASCLATAEGGFAVASGGGDESEKCTEKQGLGSAQGGNGEGDHIEAKSIALGGEGGGMISKPAESDEEAVQIQQPYRQVAWHQAPLQPEIYKVLLSRLATGLTSIT